MRNTKFNRFTLEKNRQIFSLRNLNLKMEKIHIEMVGFSTLLNLVLFDKEKEFMRKSEV